ncbi:polyhomeotic-proximal chromatin protein-like isoform X2 [Leguminivora glycinivorella]|nr:polyhomeotic-proximal chromatin protein-like isoform X2 [Leguminivora glycinivorella]
MQQQMCQPDQMGQPQQQQQVMLCPVRLIYETQILVQPGEQIQPNQTLFINPQNPPPWIQNQVRPQNQVIYMQQMPGNMMPSVPQHMDQNQMYLQNLQGYYPQQMIQMDPRQMQNVVQMMPNIGQITGQNVNLGQNVINVGQNVSNMPPNVLNTGQNVMTMSNVVQNVQKPANSGVNIAQNQNNMPSIVSNDRVYNSSMPNTMPMANQNTMTNATQIQDRTGNMNQNLVNMQKVAELQGMRQQNLRQPQVTVSPMQNVKYAPNPVDIRPVAPQNVGDIRVNSPRPMTITSNIPNNVMQANALNKKVPIPNKPNPVMTNQIRHYNQNYYRHIQPKPMSVTPMQNQYMPSGSQTITGPRPPQSLNEFNRKRKSESPDETKKKVPNMGNQTVMLETANGTTISYVPTPVRDFKLVSRNVETASTGTQANIAKEKPLVVDMKVLPPIKDNAQIESDKLVRNTVFTQAAQALNRPLLRTEPQPMQPDVVIRIEKLHSPTKTPTEPMTFVTSEAKSEPAKPETSKPNTEIVKIETAKANAELAKLETPKPSMELLKIETPVHAITGVNSRFREPLLLDKPVPSSIPFALSASLNEPKPSNNKPLQPQPSKPEVQIKTETKASSEFEMATSRTEPKTPKQRTETPKIETITKPEKGTETPKIENTTKRKEVKASKVKKEDTTKSKLNIKDEKTSEPIKPEAETKIKEEAKDVKEEKRKFTVTSINDFKGSELQIANGSVRKEDTDHYILTHVLDGYVIQESNTAFPIRKPLKEKIIYQNADLSMEPKKEESYKHRTEDGKLIKDNSKILSISDLNLNEDEVIESETEIKDVKTKEETDISEDAQTPKAEEKCDGDSEQPFANVTPSTIKSWTVDQLASHLSKYNWAETISVLSEHEIDGESLFLVNKQQLMHIGVSETHADVICEFIKNS